MASLSRSRPLGLAPALLTVLVSWSVGARGEAPDYLAALRSAVDFDIVSIPSTLGGEKDRFTKYLVPATGEAALSSTLFQNAGKYPFHQEFLRNVFPELFPGLDMAEYLALVERRATRQYYAGVLSRYRTEDGILYGFSVFTSGGAGDSVQKELLTAEETRFVYERLDTAIDLGAPLVYAPDTHAAVDAAVAWQNPGFPLYLGGVARSTYEAYTRAVSYGRVRLLSPSEFEEANGSGRITWQDILVLDRAPSDIEGVVAGVITGEPQGELSHVAIRTARRGTPNAFVEDARRAFASLDGKLVRLEVKATEYTVRGAEPEEAKVWWDENRPSLSVDPVVDSQYAALDALEEMDLSGATAPPEARYGGKAANLARLQRVFTGPMERYRAHGFVIPMKYYLEFLRSNRTHSALDPKRKVTYEEYLAEILAWDRFRSDGEVRFQELARFREMVRDDGAVDPTLVGRIIGRVQEVFGSTDVMVRCRSSSNVEDALEFNGAGLYESTSACAADELDGDVTGPSLCDPRQSKERAVARALKKVWASLWTFRANEERSYYGIPVENVAMGVLVTRAFLDEQANGVAFTGNPANSRDPRYLVTSQVGEESVVSPEPGKLAAKDVLTVAGGRLVAIDRVRPSSLLPDGHVLSDEILEELGLLLWHVDESFPVNLEGHDREDVMLDLEFKVESDGSLAVKQVRPFLASEPPPAGPTFELVIPPETTVCGVFLDGRDPQGEYEHKSQLRLAAGTHSLPTEAPLFEGHLINEAFFGPEAQRAASLGPGLFRWTTRAEGDGKVTYEFSYEETFRPASGEDLVIKLSQKFTVRPGEPPELSRTLDEDFIASGLILSASRGEGTLVRYASCAYSSLPRWSVHAVTEAGDVFDLEERFLEDVGGTGPAKLAGAELTLGTEHREVHDYWSLLYAAQHHNTDVQYWVVLDPPVTVAGAAASVRIVELSEPRLEVGVPARARYLGADFEVLSEPEVVCYRKGAFGEPLNCGFRRGDTDSTGKVNITDAIFLLNALFRGGVQPACPDAADFNDDGFLDTTDVVLILSYLFRGVDLSAPPGPRECGVDPTPDFLPECSDPSCS